MTELVDVRVLVQSQVQPLYPKRGHNFRSLLIDIGAPRPMSSISVFLALILQMIPNSHETSFVDICAIYNG